jgi:predicted lipid-binding transport protein (Tim44 family)
LNFWRVELKKILMSVFMAVLSLTFVAQHVEAKRLGGGSSSGMKRQMPARQAPTSPAQQPAQPSVAPGGQAVPPTVAPKRNWMGPIAGLAAGLGIAALMSHFGMGAAFGNMIMMALLAVAAFFAIRWVMGRFANSSPVPATSGGPRLSPNDFAREPVPPAQSMSRDMPAAAPPQGVSDGMLSGPSFASVAAGTASSLPPGFDAPAFERIAKLIFIRMQAANDASNLDDLRQFSTPEMFAVFKLELQDRGNAPQVTDVVQLNAEVLDFADEADRQIVSVRFHGLIREEKDAPTTTFDEIWHLAKPKAGSGEWAIAGIAQTA